MAGASRARDGAAGAEAEAPTLQARLEGHLLGRAALTGFIVLVLASILVSNLPDSAIRREARPMVEPFLDATGLGQRWNLFAPDPRNSTRRLVARMTYPDGVTVQWHQPEGDPVLGSYREYRWRKFAARIMQDGGQPLRGAFAEWLARTHPRDGQAPVRVVLVRQWYRAPDPGSGDLARPPWQEVVLHRAELGGPGS